MSIALFLAAAAAAAPVCDGAPPPLPTPLSGWTRPSPVHDMLPLGTSASLTLKPSAGFAYAVAPPKADAADSFSGMYAFRIDKAGRYAVALSLPAWIDVIRDSKSVASTAHQHGPDCSDIRKIVIFDLTPGAYTLQLNNSPSTDATLLVTPWP